MFSKNIKSMIVALQSRPPNPGKRLTEADHSDQ